SYPAQRELTPALPGTRPLFLVWVEHTVGGTASPAHPTNCFAHFKLALAALLLLSPSVFLTEHFWTPEQRLEFSSAQLRRRQSEYRHLIDDLAFLQPQLNSAALRILLPQLLKRIHLSRASGISAFRLYREYRLWRLAKLLYEEDRAVERANFVFADPTKTLGPGGGAPAEAAVLLGQRLSVLESAGLRGRQILYANGCRLSAGLRDTK
uniref:LETM1 domain-containing protein n=1 Tax=Macrostomum lignano TaxID=282301 RepID=A0A1I8FGC8_9PLAT